MRHNYDRHPSVADSVVTQDTFNDRAPRPLNTHHLRNSLGRIGVVDIGYSEWNEDGRIRGLHRTHAISHRSYYYLKACTFVRAKKKKTLSLVHFRFILVSGVVITLDKDGEEIVQLDGHMEKAGQQQRRRWQR